MLKRILVALAIALCLMGCSEKRSGPIQFLYTNGTTKTGLPKIDHKKSLFDIDDFIIIEADDSEAFYEIGYCKEFELLLVTFEGSYETYVYGEFSEDDWNSFIIASSLGRWYNENIKNKYSCYFW